jgi:pathogen-inducible salicylic acid glucosyltransferase
MEIEMKKVKSHVLVLSYPSTGHTNPMLQFSKNIASRGLLVTFVTFSYNHHKVIQAKEFLQWLKLPIQFECIPDSLPQDHSLDSNISSVVFQHMNNNFDGSELEQLIQRLNASGNAPPVRCIVYNPFLPWGRKVAQKMNISHAMFWTQSTAVFNIYHHFYKGETWDSRKITESVSVAIPSLPELKLGDLPLSFTSTVHKLQNYLHQMDGLSDVSWVLGNTFYELEPETIDYLTSRMGVPFRSIGPCIPSAFLDGRNPHDAQVGADPWKATDTVKEWLDKKPPSSVVYIAFGSITILSAQQISELALGIQCSRQNFLWVIRPPPGHEDIGEFFPAGFVEETKGRGLVVNWCVQLEVLSHPSVAAFMSHCGWNSTLEALSLGIPVLTLGVWTDQTTNSKFLADVWMTGVRMRKQEDGTVGREEIERCMRMAVDKTSQAGKELRKNALKWKELAKTAMSEGGSSDVNLNEFVNGVVAKAMQSSSSVPH